MEMIGRNRPRSRSLHEWSERGSKLSESRSLADGQQITNSVLLATICECDDERQPLHKTASDSKQSSDATPPQSPIAEVKQKPTEQSPLSFSNDNLSDWMVNEEVTGLAAEVSKRFPTEKQQRPNSFNGCPAITSDDVEKNFDNESAERVRLRSTTAMARTRLMGKKGECNVSLNNVPDQRTKFFADMFTTLVDAKWRWCLMTFVSSFLLSWLMFALIYYMIMFSHGDLDRLGDENWHFCINNIHNFYSVFMFSLETQHTIGYGSRYPSEDCPAVLAVVCLQSMIGVMIQTFMAGIVFAKLARAKKRAQTLIFSQKAVICMRDGKLCFLFRIGDMRKSPLAEAHVRAQLIGKRITDEGELLPFHQYDMNVGYDRGLDRVFVVWPITICHVIDSNSPLYEYGADDLPTARFEIVAILEGVGASTGATMQARTSYLPSEIIWGHRFEKLVTYQRENGEYRIDFGKFHKTYPQETPACSARDLDVLRDAGLNIEKVYQIETAEEAENQGLTPFSSLTPKSSSRRSSLASVVEVQVSKNDQDQPEDEEDDRDELQDRLDESRLLLPPSVTTLMAMSPAKRKASIVAAAAVFRKQKSVTESVRKASITVSNRSVTPRRPEISRLPSVRSDEIPASPTIRHASSTGAIPQGGHNRPPFINAAVNPTVELKPPPT